MNFLDYIVRHREWSLNTHGTPEQSSSLGVARHIENELETEILPLLELNRPVPVEEWADVIILAIDGAWRQGATADDLCQALQAKQKKNMAREWPKPGENKPDQPNFHKKKVYPVLIVEIIHSDKTVYLANVERTKATDSAIPIDSLIRMDGAKLDINLALEVWATGSFIALQLSDEIAEQLDLTEDNNPGLFPE